MVKFVTAPWKAALADSVTVSEEWKWNEKQFITKLNLYPCTKM